MRAFAVCAVVLAGCAQISGLDVLDIADATATDSAADALDDVLVIDAAVLVDARADTNDSSTVIVDAAKDAAKEAAPDPCKRPADCPGAGAVCCETIIMSGNQSCTIDADTTACASANACATTFGFTCGKEIFRRCTATADCVEQNYPKCCTIPVGDASSREVCLSLGVASILNATCL